MSSQAASAAATTSGGRDSPSGTPSPDKKTEKKEKKASEKDLDLEQRNRGVWLVKVPNYIAQRWEQATKPNETVAKLTIERVPGKKPVVSLKLDEKLTKAMPEAEWTSTTKGIIPQEHKFVVNPVNMQHLAVLSNTRGGGVSGGDKIAVEGRVIQRAECRATDDSLYMKLKTEAILRPAQNARKTQFTGLVMNPYKPVSNHAANIQFEKARKEMGKKSRDDKHVVTDKLFSLFEKHQYYSFTDLVKETRQPAPYLKEILNEYCKYNLKNPHKNMWELKPEYRHYKDDKDDEDPVEGSSQDEKMSDSE